MLAALKSKLLDISQRMGGIQCSKPMIKASLRFLLPGVGEILAEGIDDIFELAAEREDQQRHEELAQKLSKIESDQVLFLNLLDKIDQQIGHILQKMSSTYQGNLNISAQGNPQPSKQDQQDQDKLLKDLFDQHFQKEAQEFQKLQIDLISLSKQFSIVQKQLDVLLKTLIEHHMVQKQGQDHLAKGIEALRVLYLQLSEQIEYNQQAHFKDQAFREFLIEIEHELLNHHLNRARVVLENAFIKKTIDLAFKHLYECKINALQGHLSQIEELIQQSKDLEHLKMLGGFESNLQNASRYVSNPNQYRTFVHQSQEELGDKGWKLDLPLGLGGMGEVWRATNLKGEIGAIKFVHQELLAEDFGKRKFFDEIESLSKLAHDHIVKLKDWGVDKSTQQLYLVMEYIEGETLRQRINRKAYLSWDEAKVIFRALLEALYLCHQSNIIHKDIKPDNIILKCYPKNHPVLLDFGIAKIKKTANPQQTKTGISGSDLYMSPEQRTGKVDEKSDIYSLGITLLESLTGECASNHKLVLDNEILDLVERNLLVPWRIRFNVEQLYKALGGDPDDLKKESKQQHIMITTALQQELLTLQARYQSLLNENDVLKTALDQYKRDNQLSANQLSEAHQSYQLALQQLESNDQEIQRLKVALLQTEQELQKKDQKIQELWDKMHKANSQIKEIQEQLQKKLKELDQVKTHIIQKEKEISSLKQVQQQEISTRDLTILELQQALDAKQKLDAKQEQTSHPVSWQTSGLRAGSLKMIEIKQIRFHMVYCPAGEFWMGSELGVGSDDEKPRHRVKMTKDFWMGETQVTQELWQAVMGWNPSYFKGSVKRPAESMTWYDCLLFCNQLSELEGFKPCYALSQIQNNGKHIKSAEVEWKRDANGYRLPTEAEWEYSAKAGTKLTYSGSNTIDEVAWYHVNSGNKTLSENLWKEVNQNSDKWLEALNANSNKTHDVKTKKANAWGLHDMSGNVWEWCHDMWDDKAYQNRGNVENPVKWQNGPCARVLRGGSSWDLADFCRVDSRNGYVADNRRGGRGLRLLRFEP